MEGPQLFLRYAFMPNKLGYCGSDDNSTLFLYGIESVVDDGLLELEQKFEGAYPYLQLIARANQLPDPLDERVVEAYWVGNSLLDGVDMSSFYDSLEERFRARSGSSDWRWLASKVPAAARPHHSFHVLEIFPRVGLLNSGARERVIETMGNCIIRWGQVDDVSGDFLTVRAPRLVMRDGKLELTDLEVEPVTRAYAGQGFVTAIEPGDWVSIHWGWACDKLTEVQRANLARRTLQHIALCNETT